MPGNQMEKEALCFEVRNRIWASGTTCQRGERPDADELAAFRTTRSSQAITAGCGRVPPDDEWKLTKRPRPLAVIQPFTPLAAVVTIGASEAKRFWTDFL
jgi:hypothetical protein